MIDLSRIRSLDTETPKFRPGEAAPRIVCASTARVEDGKIVGELLTRAQARAIFRSYLEAGYLVMFAHAAYDLCVFAEEDPTLLPLIFRAMRLGKVYDILISQGLDAIYGGHHGQNPDGSDLRKSTGEVTRRYSLDVVHKLVTGRSDAKKNDVWRKSYGILEHIPFDRWPVEAKIYPIEDASNTFEDGVYQMSGVPQQHAWVEMPAIPAITPGLPVIPGRTACRYCDGDLALAASTPFCERAPRVPNRNADNHVAQVRASVALALGAAHGLRTDPEKVEKLTGEAQAKNKIAVERFQKKGWIREDGTGDQAAVKRDVALAYGATGKCARCEGGGKVRKPKWVECRGEKVKGRYKNCVFATAPAPERTSACLLCFGAGQVQQYGNPVTCKNEFDANDVMMEEGCDGTGLDLNTARLLPRTDKGGVGTDRDTLMESGNDDLSDYGENEHEKTLSTFIPYLLSGTRRPLLISANVLLASGRCSYEGCPIHQFPRDGHERECIRARGAWCNCPVEHVLGSTDYSAGELCTLGQFTYWLFGYSQMREAINESGDPGILHSALAAQVLGLSLDEFLVRLKAKDKFAILIRQSSKPMNFGKPAAMGAPKIVWTNRKKNAGFTVCEGGPAQNRKGEPGYWGIRFCITVGGKKSCGDEKITEWKKQPTVPVCKACCDVVENVLTPAYFLRFPEIRDYHEWGKRMIKQKKPAPSVIWDQEAQQPRIIRERGFLDWDKSLSALLNNGFQSMLADIGKDAFTTATEECYTGVKEDGSPSPLGGSRLPVFIHDEPLSELILDTAHLSGPRIAEIMIASGKKMAPDVVWKAETALAFFWSKSMEPTYDANNKLIPWGPIPEYLQARLAA